MNGVHDMDGMHGMGPIQYESNEPVFHEPWEARVFALNLAGLAWGKWTIDSARHAVERIPASEYLRMSYYELWLESLVELMVKAGLITRAEVESGKPAPGSPKATTALGGSKPRSAMPCISTCGTTTLSAPKSILEPERLQALPRLPRG